MLFRSKVPKRTYSRDSFGRFTRAKRPRRTKRESSRENDRRCSTSVGLTKVSESPKLRIRLIDDRPDVVSTLLAPLREGKPVWLEVNDKRLPKKTRKYRTILVICPLRALGYNVKGFLVAMPPYGAEIVDSETDLKGITFARLGLSFSLASALADALHKGGFHG